MKTQQWHDKHAMIFYHFNYLMISWSRPLVGHAHVTKIFSLKHVRSHTSLRSKGLEVVGERKNGHAGVTCLLLARVLFFLYYFEAPATQAIHWQLNIMITTKHDILWNIIKRSHESMPQTQCLTLNKNINNHINMQFISRNDLNDAHSISWSCSPVITSLVRRTQIPKIFQLKRILTKALWKQRII